MERSFLATILNAGHALPAILSAVPAQALRYAPSVRTRREIDHCVQPLAEITEPLFSEPPMQAVWEAMLDILEADRIITLPTVLSALLDRGDLAKYFAGDADVPARHFDGQPNIPQVALPDILSALVAKWRFRLTARIEMEAMNRINNGSRPEIVEREKIATILALQPPPRAVEIEKPNDTKLPPFPLDALPLWIRTYVAEQADALQVPIDMMAVLCLAALSGAVAGKIELQLHADHVEPVNLYAVVAMPVASRKSSAFKRATWPIIEYEREVRRELEPILTRQRQDKAIKQLRLNTLLKLAARGQPNAQDEADALLLSIKEPEPMPRLIFDDVSPEVLPRHMASRWNAGRAIIMSSEGGVFETIAGRYMKGAHGNYDIILKAASGDRHIEDRISREGYTVPKCSITICLTVQPDVIRCLTSKPGFSGRGMLGRLLYCIPESIVGYRKSMLERPTPSVATGETYGRTIKHLCRIPFQTGNDGEPTPYVLELTHEAAVALDAFEKEIERELRPDTGALSGIGDWAGKFFGTTARFAALHHVATRSFGDAWRAPVQLESAQAAIAIGRYAVAHAICAYTMMGMPTADLSDERLKRDLIAFLADRRVASRQEFWVAMRRRIGHDRDLLNAVLDGLASTGKILSIPQKGAPGRPGDLFVAIEPK
jgi:hypothetical protein